MTIYFVHDAENKAIKIGYSKTPQGCNKRLTSLQVGSSTDLTMLAIVDNHRSNKEGEKYIHELFKPFHLRGEWFKSYPVIRWLCHHIDKLTQYDFRLLDQYKKQTNYTLPSKAGERFNAPDCICWITNRQIQKWVKRGAFVEIQKSWAFVDENGFILHECIVYPISKQPRVEIPNPYDQNNLRGLPGRATPFFSPAIEEIVYIDPQTRLVAVGYPIASCSKEAG